jgi:flagellar secretion chaperone FliS
MTYQRQGARYQETEILSASPERLVVILYDHLLVSLRRARVAIETKAIEPRGEALTKSRDILIHLIATLDRDQGGEIAANLSALYAWMLNELIQISRRPDATRVDHVLRSAQNLRDGFAQAAERATVAVA